MMNSILVQMNYCSGSFKPQIESGSVTSIKIEVMDLVNLFSIVVFLPDYFYDNFEPNFIMVIYCHYVPNKVHSVAEG